MHERPISTARRKASPLKREKWCQYRETKKMVKNSTANSGNSLHQFYIKTNPIGSSNTATRFYPSWINKSWMKVPLVISKRSHYIHFSSASSISILKLVREILQIKPILRPTIELVADRLFFLAQKELFLFYCDKLELLNQSSDKDIASNLNNIEL